MAALFVLTAIASPSGASVEAVQDTTQTAWPSTIYYIASISSPDGLGAGYGDVTFNITAVNDYELYVNGELLGTNADGDWQTVESYTQTITNEFINIGVAVHNDGNGEGNGLMVDVVPEDGSHWLGTSIKQRRLEQYSDEPRLFRVQWYYFSGSLEELEEITSEPWYEAAFTGLYQSGDVTPVPTFTQNFKLVQLGEMGDIDYIQDPNVDIVTGYVGNTDVGSVDNGGIKLRRIDGENLALGKPTDNETLVDGDLENGVKWGQDPTNRGYQVDLERMYRVNSMVLYTGGTQPNDWPRVSVRGYRVELSFDDFTWDEVGIIHDIGERNEGGHNYYAVDFPQEWARYVRFRISESRIDYPNVGEMQVYGVGHVYDGTYESDWIDFGDPLAVKNFGTMTWDGDVPDGTDITIQTKSGLMNQEGEIDESRWSIATADRSFTFPSPEPATMFKYRVNLRTQDVLKSPVLESLSLQYSTEDQPVSFADGLVTPNELPMGETSTLEYIISYNLADGQNLKQVQLAVPGYSELNSVYSSELESTLTEDNGLLPTLSSVDTLYVRLDNPITNDQGGTAADSLYISFDTKLLGNTHDFVASLYNATGNDGAGGVKVWESDAGTWTAVSSSITEGVLQNVQASPEAFTPNGDGVNEFTVIEFELSKVKTDVKINIYDTKGSLVTVVADQDLLPGTYLIPDSQKMGANAMDLVGYWDGRDEDGDLVPPGVYLYQVVAQTDDGDKVEGGTVVVAY